MFGKRLAKVYDHSLAVELYTLDHTRDVPKLVLSVCPIIASLRTEKLYITFLTQDNLRKKHSSMTQVYVYSLQLKYKGIHYSNHIGNYITCLVGVPFIEFNIENEVFLK